MNQTKSKILLVDDDRLLLDVLARALEHSEYGVVTVSNGQEALRQLDNGPVDLVVTDIIMPDMEGLETIRTMRRRNPTAKIIAMSGGGMIDPQSYLAMARKLGVSATLQKPFTHQDMLNAIERVLKATDPAMEKVVTVG